MSGKKKIFDFSLFNRIFQFVQPYKRQFYASLVMAIVLAFATIVRPILIMDAVNIGAGKPAKMGAFMQWLLGHPESPERFIIAITIFQIAFIIVETAIRFAFTFLTSWLGQAVVKDMRITIFNKVIHLNLKQFDTTPIGTLTTRTINDIESINDIFSDGLLPILADLLSIIVVLAAMLMTDWQLTLISLIPLPIMFVATYYFKESVNKSFITVRNAVAALNAFVQEHITGMHIVQAFAAEEREFNKFEKINNEHKTANIKSIFAYSVFFPIVEVVLALSTGLLVWWISKESLKYSPEKAIELAGKLTAFLLLINAIFRPLRFIADKFNTLQMGMIAAERVFKVLDNEDYIQQQGNHQPKEIKGKITFDHVWFAYEKEHYVLKNINFEAQPGQTIALVGHTGSGKTSIISLLNRLYHINKGDIKLDDVRIEDYDLDTLRKNIGIVLQDVFLFSGSVMDNITLYNPEITRDKVIEVAKLIGVHDFIMRLPNNYDYNVMERGNTLSLGQRQLIAFIRALLYNPSVLILDEATSSIDSESEQLIQNAIDKLVTGRTAIVIAHRLSTIRKADKILVLDKGEIVETGNHDELLKLGGFYSKLHHMQFEKNASTLTEVLSK